ncbi:MAG: hypothetical protein JSR15_08755 [Proteobacteria bacterium]|nr:hypothetical protein [Pseudomonadota bacterium]
MELRALDSSFVCQRSRFRYRAAEILLLAVVALPAAAVAAPEEIQVYMDEMNDPGKFGLDLHNNYVVSGDEGSDYPGGQASLHTYRLTPEFSYGLDKSFELGAYLPLLTVTGQNGVRAQGVKARIKYLSPSSRDRNRWWGVNLEIGRVDHALDTNPWNVELKGIVGGHIDKWLLAANFNFDAVVSGPQHGPVSVDVDTKLSYLATPNLRLGLESYNGLGAASHPGPLSSQDQSLYLAADTRISRWELNVGIGRGYGASRDGWIVKAIVGVPLGQ